MKYNPTTHAIERVRERFGVMEENGADFLNELMRTAKYVMTQPDGRMVYKNAEHDVMLAVNGKTKTVITVFETEASKRKRAAAKLKSQRLSDAITATVRREIAKARRTFTATTRTLSEQHALLQIEIGKLTLNKVRCKHPGTQAIIQRKISAISTQMEALAQDIERTESEYKALRAEAAALIGQEVAQ